MRCRGCGDTYDALLPGSNRERCPRCTAGGAALAVRPPSDFVAVEVEDATLAESVECPKCAEPIKARAVVCRWCGYDLERGTRPASRGLSLGGTQHVVVHIPKSPGVAVVLSFFWSGLGQMYCGRIGKGLAFMLAPLLLLFLWFSGALVVSRGPYGETGYVAWIVALPIGFFLLWIWQLVDAYQTAQSAGSAGPYGRRRPRFRRRLR